MVCDTGNDRLSVFDRTSGAFVRCIGQPPAEEEDDDEDDADRSNGDRSNGDRSNGDRSNGSCSPPTAPPAVLSAPRAVACIAIAGGAVAASSMVAGARALVPAPKGDAATTALLICEKRCVKILSMAGALLQEVCVPCTYAHSPYAHSHSHEHATCRMLLVGCHTLDA